MPGAASADDVLARYGLQVVDRDLATLITPRIARPDRPVTMSDVSPDDEQACLATVGHALAAYPPGFVKALVKTLALAEDLRAWNRSVSGVQIPGLVIVDCQQPVANAPYQAANVHDALAALVIDAAPPDWTAWRAANKPGFRYDNLDAYKAELSDPDARDLAARLNEDGFVSRYGLVGEENDFQTYAEQVFGNGRKFAALVSQSSPMQHKLAVLLDTYLALAPSLRTYFDSTGLTRAARLSPARR